MIKSKDLRVGNYVLFEGDPMPIFEFSNGLELMTFGVKRNNYSPGVTDDYSPQNIEPIALTAEILTEWCGFTRDPEWGVALFITNHLSAHWDEFWKHATFSFYNLLYRQNQRITDVKTLHQLQNLYFALTGAELEIKIPQKA